MKELTLDDVAGALDRLNYDCRDTWVQMGMAIKTEFGEAGFDTWNAWSEMSGLYDAAAAKSVWKSFRKGGVGIGTLVKAAKEAGWAFNPDELDEAERKRRREEAEQRRQALAAEIEADEQARVEWHERVAVASVELEGLMAWGGKSDYLSRKKVRPYGIKFVTHGLVVVTHIKAKRIEIINGKASIDTFFVKVKSPEFDREATSFKYLRYGTVAIPLRDIGGKLWGWQFIPEKGGKQFLKFGRKSGLFHFIAADAAGDYGQGVAGFQAATAFGEGQVITQAEGYATGASIHQATGYPCAIALDSGNMAKVAKAMRGAWPEATLLFCGDNDRDTDGNPGVKAANEAAILAGGCVAIPDFSRYEEQAA